LGKELQAMIVVEKMALFHMVGFCGAGSGGLVTESLHTPVMKEIMRPNCIQAVNLVPQRDTVRLAVLS
jgi:hypothetical protein